MRWQSIRNFYTIRVLQTCSLPYTWFLVRAESKLHFLTLCSTRFFKYLYKCFLLKVGKMIRWDFRIEILSIQLPCKVTKLYSRSNTGSKKKKRITFILHTSNKATPADTLPRCHSHTHTHTFLKRAPWCLVSVLLFLSLRDNSEKKTSHWTNTLAVTTINCRKKCAYRHGVMTETVCLVSGYLSHEPTTAITAAYRSSSTISLGFRDDSICRSSSVKTLFSKSWQQSRWSVFKRRFFTVVNMCHSLLIIWRCRPQSIPDSVTSTAKYALNAPHFCLEACLYYHILPQHKLKMQKNHVFTQSHAYWYLTILPNTDLLIYAKLEAHMKPTWSHFFSRIEFSLGVEPHKKRRLSCCPLIREVNVKDVAPGRRRRSSASARDATLMDGSESLLAWKGEVGRGWRRSLVRPGAHMLDCSD